MTEQLIELVLNMGEQMLRCGAEISRVEDTMKRVCMAYSAERAEVFSITSCIILTVKLPEMEAKTQMRRIAGYETDLTRLQKLNEFSRWVCREKPDLCKAMTAFSEIGKTTSRAGVRAGLYVLIATAFSIYFGCGVAEAFCSAGVAICLFLIEWFFTRIRLNRFFMVFLTMALCSMITAILFRVGIVVRVDRILIGNIMLMVPGLAFTNSIRDVVSGDVVSGLMRLVESLFLVVALAAGCAVGLLPFGIGG